MILKFLILLIFCTGLGLAQEESFDWQALGEKTYGTCTGCHQANGQGLPGIFPPLAGHLPNVIAKEAGRSYLINVLLYGLRGEILVLGQKANGEMPMWSSMSDEQLAAVLNHVLHSWDNEALLPEDFAPIMPSEIAAERNQGLSAHDVFALREALGLIDEE